MKMKVKKEKEKKMSQIQKCCGYNTNHNHCKAMIDPKTGLPEQCVLKSIELKRNCENKNKEKKIKFLQDKIMDLGLATNECIRRIEKTANGNKKEEKIKEIRKQIEKKRNKINSRIKSLLMPKLHLIKT